MRVTTMDRYITATEAMAGIMDATVIACCHGTGVNLIGRLSGKASVYEGSPTLRFRLYALEVRPHVNHQVEAPCVRGFFLSYLGPSLVSCFLISGLSYKTTFNNELRISSFPLYLI